MFGRRHYLYVGLIVLVIFGVGVSIGMNLDSLKKQLIEKDSLKLTSQIEDFVITNEIINKLSIKDCAVIQPYLVDITNQVENLGNELEDFENKGLITGDGYNLLKNRYFLNEIQYWISVEKYRECDPGLVTILFFYGDDDDSIRQGFVLTKLREENIGKVFVFNFYVMDKDNNSVKLIKKIYGIEDSPTLVINSNTTLTGFQSLESLRDATQLK